MTLCSFAPSLRSAVAGHHGSRLSITLAAVQQAALSALRTSGAVEEAGASCAAHSSAGEGSAGARGWTAPGVAWKLCALRDGPCLSWFTRRAVVMIGLPSKSAVLGAVVACVERCARNSGRPQSPVHRVGARVGTNMCGSRGVVGSEGGGWGTLPLGDPAVCAYSLAACASRPCCALRRSALGVNRCQSPLRTQAGDGQPATARGPAPYSGRPRPAATAAATARLPRRRCTTRVAPATAPRRSLPRRMGRLQREHYARIERGR